MQNEKYTEIRVNGLYSSYVLYSLVKKLRTKYLVPTKGMDYIAWLKIKMIARIPEIASIAKHLEIDPLRLQYFMVTNHRDELAPILLSRDEEADRNRGIFQSPDGYLPSGTYIKVDINTTKDDIIEKLYLAKKILKKQSKPGEKHRVQISDTDELNIKYHHTLERKLIEIMEDPQKTRETYNGPFEDQLVKIAVEQAAGEIINNKYGEEDEDDHFEEEIKLQSHIRDRYYKFVNRYRLPTIRDLPTLLRLTGL